jgi:hypothetical protein
MYNRVLKKTKRQFIITKAVLKIWGCKHMYYYQLLFRTLQGSLRYCTRSYCHAWAWPPSYPLLRRGLTGTAARVHFFFIGLISFYLLYSTAK